MAIFFTILILILIVSLSTLVTQMIPFQIPLPLIQIVLGAVIALPIFGLKVEFDPELFLVLFIPPLLFADGRRMPIREFIHYGREIIGLALVLVILTVTCMAYIINYLIPEMPLSVCFALAAVLSPTDAVALSGIVGKGRVPHSIMGILEGEALMNDASGLVSLKFALKVAMGLMIFDTASDYTVAGLEFAKVSLGGIVVGIAVTWCYRRLLFFVSRWSADDPVTQVLSFFTLPFIAYLAAEHLDMSGILAAVASGMMIGNSKGLSNVSLEMRLRGNSVWSTLEVVLNGLVFIMLGSQIPGIMVATQEHLNTDSTMTVWKLLSDIVIIYAGLMFMRFIWLWMMKMISKHLMKKNPLLFAKYSTRELLLATFAGVRGAITLAGALSVPFFLDITTGVEFPGRYQLIFLAMGVILFSLICGVIILPVLLQGLTNLDPAKQLEQEYYAEGIMSETAIKSVEKLRERLESSTEEDIDPHLLSEISSKLVTSLRQHTEAEKKAEMQQAEQLERRFRLVALRAQRGELYHLRAKQRINHETMEKFLYELDLKETLLVDKI